MVLTFYWEETNSKQIHIKSYYQVVISATKGGNKVKGLIMGDRGQE